MPRPNGRDPKRDPKAYLGSKLKAGRIKADFSSQDSLAAKLGFDRTVISKAESGERVPTDAVLETWCSECGLDLELFREWAELARAIDGPVPTWFEDYLDAESAAHMLRYWQPIIIPAIFTTPDYRRAVLVAAGNDAERADEMVAATLKRQELLERASPPEVVAVLDEMVLRRLVGSSAIMHDQLLHLAGLAERPNVQILVIPTTDVGANAGLSGPVNIASGDGVPDVLHTDAVPEGHTTETRPLVHAATVAFERVRGDALSRRQSRDLILRLAEELWKS